MNPESAQWVTMSNGRRQAFRDFVLNAGQVQAGSFLGLAERAPALVTLHDGPALIGTAAIKIPNASYHEAVFKKAGVETLAPRYPLELGWIVVSEGYRGRKLSRALMAMALNFARGSALYATTKNDRMKHLLASYQFTVEGQSYASGQDADLKVTLYVKAG